MDSIIVCIHTYIIIQIKMNNGVRKNKTSIYYAKAQGRQTVLGYIVPYLMTKSHVFVAIIIDRHQLIL